MRLLTTSLPLVLLVLTAVETRAQISDPSLVLATRAYDEDADCTNSPGVCDALTSQDHTGIHELLVFGYSADEGGILSAEFSLDWPDDWTVLDWAACRAPLSSGDPTTPRSLLVFDLDDCHRWDTPLLRIVVDCPTPGRARFSHQETRLCWDEFLGFAMASYVEVGDFCGRLPRVTPCDGLFCDDLAGHFATASLRSVVPEGSIRTDTLSVYVGSCGSIPECDGGYDHGCGASLSSDTEWMSVERVDHSGRQHRFVVTIDASTLGLGEYGGRVYLERGFTGCCTETCMEVSLEVSPLSPVIEKSWGTLKSRFR